MSKPKVTSQPLVSVIMNCHNGEKYLKQTILSVINQAYKNWEIIFWDNKSNDQSEKIAKSFNDKRIKYFKSNKFEKLYRTRNLAIKKSKGKYICFLDTDDFWNKNKLRSQINLIKKKNCKIIYTNFLVKNENTKKLYLPYKKKLPEGFITQDLLNQYCIGILTIMIDRKIFKKNKFYERYDVIGDFDLFLKLSKKYEILAIQKPLATFRVHNKNFSSKNIGLYLDEFNLWLKKNRFKLYNDFNLRQIKINILKLRTKKIINKIF
tara:strand:+ start:1420 stop:2211 length:792 start_codon:yes stop_codon:yes gene_type:complete